MYPRCGLASHIPYRVLWVGVADQTQVPNPVVVVGTASVADMGRFVVGKRVVGRRVVAVSMVEVGMVVVAVVVGDVVVSLFVVFLFLICSLV